MAPVCRPTGATTANRGDGNTTSRGSHGADIGRSAHTAQVTLTINGLLDHRFAAFARDARNCAWLGRRLTAPAHRGVRVAGRLKGPVGVLPRSADLKAGTQWLDQVAVTVRFAIGPRPLRPADASQHLCLQSYWPRLPSPVTAP